MRAWLTENKIFFEVTNLIIFSLVTCWLSYRTFALQKDSALVEITAKLPDIRVTGSNITISDEGLQIENVGERLNEPRFEISSFIEFTVDRKTHVLPVVYYVACTQYLKPVGLLQKCIQPGNRSEFYRLYTDAIKLVQSNISTSTDLRLKTFVSAHYRDIFGKEHEQCLAGDTMGAYEEDLNCSGVTKEKEKTKNLLPMDIEKVTLSGLMRI